MIIPIIFASSLAVPKLPPALATISNDEVVLIELQGSLEVEGESDKDGQVVGQFKMDASNSKPTLTIGHHLLEGKIASLPKPLAVLRRTGTRISEAEYDELTSYLETPSQWNAIAIVRRKIVFAKRPMPLSKMA